MPNEAGIEKFLITPNINQAQISLIRTGGSTIPSLLTLWLFALLKVGWRKARTASSHSIWRRRLQKTLGPVPVSEANCTWNFFVPINRQIFKRYSFAGWTGIFCRNLVVPSDQPMVYCVFFPFWLPWVFYSVFCHDMVLLVDPVH